MNKIVCLSAITVAILFSACEKEKVQEDTGFENGYQYVDLGLSVKWATFNVGATKPEEYGDYYAWGETETKNDYSWSTYKWSDETGNILSKYNTSIYYGTVDNKHVLDAEDDVAHVKWGGKWRMPTQSEQEEHHSNICQRLYITRVEHRHDIRHVRADQETGHNIAQNERLFEFLEQQCHHTGHDQYQGQIFNQCRQFRHLRVTSFEI